MSYTYWLPDENNDRKNIGTENNAVIIIGANGAGKSKLGAWAEQQAKEKVHRIGAQRDLNFQENIPLKNYSQAEDMVFYGTDNESSKYSKWSRWRDEYTTRLISDFENVLAALLASKSNENDKFIEKYNKFKRGELDKLETLDTVVDKLQKVWNDIFPQRKLDIIDSKFYAVFEKDGEPKKYSANQMSDGERAVLYFTAQVLCVPKNKILIIDEPELHLHRSLMNRLWKALEKLRSDCLFMYITHDTQFAALHGHADKIWIKEFDGTHWKFEKISNGNIPEELLLDILGNRKPVLFVEGEKNSYDTQLYSLLYPDYYIVPCGSCTQVIERTKAFNNNEALHHCKVYGLIDRDYRSDYEIEKYSESNIYTIDVAEVENLFLIESLIKYMANHMGKDLEGAFNQVKEYVINERFANQINGQICKSVVAELKYKLTNADISNKNDSEVKDSLDNLFESLRYEDIKSEKENIFETALTDNDYRKILMLFNEKGIVKSVGRFLDLNNNAYCRMILSLMNGDKKEEMLPLFDDYLPTEIPRNIEE